MHRVKGPLPSRDAVPHAGLLHEERAASTLHEQPATRVGSPVDDFDAPQDKAAAVTHFNGTRHGLRVDGRLAAKALEGHVDPAHVEGHSAEGVDDG